MRNLFILLFLLIPFSSALAIPRIDITKGNMDPLPIAVNNFGGHDTGTNALGFNITEVIIADLERSGLFRAVNRNAFIEQLNNSKAIPQFASWRQINAAAVVNGDIEVTQMGNIKAEFRLWDSYSEQQMAGTMFVGTQRNWRRLAHKIADEIYKAMTGESGYFNTKIAFVSEYGDPFKKTKRLSVMDQDGENLIYLTTGENLVLTPRFSPDARKILYLSYELRTPKVFLFDVETRSHRLVGHFPGMSYAPRFSPNGREAIMSVAKNGNTDIYLIDLQSTKQTKLTQGAYIDTSPHFSPDGNQVSFSSDRSGKSHIYIMNRDGSDQRRISFGEGSYFTPSWSPRGDFIAFTKILRGSFHIGVMRPDGSGERILTEGYMVEGPTWSPNGRIIMFTREEEHTRARLGRSLLQTIDITGYHERLVPTPTSASDPYWSPLLE